jgi:XTP/dITP diphosphohydrolase
MQPETLVIASHNAKKAGEMVTILSRLLPTVSFLTLRDFPEAIEPEETGATYEENALIKARSCYALTKLPSIADDAGLEVDFLDGAPGIYSKRFEGAETVFSDKMRRLLAMLDGVPEPGRSARFRCWIAFVWGQDLELTLEAVCEGRIAKEPSGDGGFGYDPIFYLPELGCTMADLTAEQKHAVSHRGKVLRTFAERLPYM